MSRLTNTNCLSKSKSYMLNCTQTDYVSLVTTKRYLEGNKHLWYADLVCRIFSNYDSKTTTYSHVQAGVGYTN